MGTISRDAGIIHKLEEALGKVMLVRNAVNELAAPSKGIPAALHRTLQQFHQREAQWELIAVAGLLSHAIGCLNGELRDLPAAEARELWHHARRQRT
jgi:hypothetical protein